MTKLQPSPTPPTPTKLSSMHFYIRMVGLFTLVLLVGMAGGIVIGRAGSNDGDERLATEFADLDAVTDVLTSNYYYRPSTDEDTDAFLGSLEQNAIGGMLTSLNDDYTRYLLPADAQIASEQLEGEYGGIGVTLMVTGDAVTISRVGPDTPAARAGLESGDAVERIDNRPVASIDPVHNGMDLRGPIGSEVLLTIRTPGESGTREVRVVREAIIVHPVAWEMISGTSIMRISIDIFGDRTTAELDQALAEATAGDATGIVLDLRGNGGGWVRSAQETIGRFLPSSVGPALYEDTTPTRGGETPMEIVNGDQPPVDLPLIVLVDGETASAAEIVAGTLRDYDRALVVGSRTFGKGSVQRVFDFADGSSLRVTVAEWLTPSKGRIQDEGVHPDVLLTAAGGTARSGDPFVQAAVQFIQDGMSTPSDLAQVGRTSTPEPATPLP
jgi:carboxyl-terminal processing protease